MKIIFEVVQVKPDMREYRQDSVHLVPHSRYDDGELSPLYVELEIPDEFRISDDTISKDALKEISNQFDLVYRGVKAIAPENIPDEEYE